MRKYLVKTFLGDHVRPKRDENSDKKTENTSENPIGSPVKKNENSSPSPIANTNPGGIEEKIDENNLTGQGSGTPNVTEDDSLDDFDHLQEAVNSFRNRTLRIAVKKVSDKLSYLALSTLS